MRKTFFFLLLLAAMFASCSKKETTTDENSVYTCSMDPQVVAYHPGKCPICHMELTKVSAQSLANDMSLHLSSEQEKLAGIQTEPAAIHEIGDEKIFPAIVSMNQNLSSTITSRVSGRIEILYYKTIGEEIKKGLPVFQVYSEQLIRDEKDYLFTLQQQKTLTSSIDAAALAEAAKQKLILWGMNRDQLYELERKGIPEPVFTVYAAEDGIIAAVLIHEGDYVNEGESIYELINLSSVWVEAQVNGVEASLSGLGTEGEVSFSGLPEKIIKSKITFINPELNANSKVVLARMEVANADEKIIPGMEAWINISGEKKKVLAVPVSSLITGADGITVWIKKKEGSYEPRMVKTGRQNKTYVEITDGIEEGDVVVISGAYLLQSEFTFKKGSNAMEGMKM